jgi:hypothetical protein
VNETAALRHWSIRLAWQGFEHSNYESLTPEQLSELRQTMETMLRRFT